MIPDFEVSLDGSDRTNVLRPLLESIEVEDKAGTDADTCYIKLNAGAMLVIPESGTDAEVKLGYVNGGVYEAFKGVVNRVGFSGPPDVLTIQATGIALSDNKRLQGANARSWNDATLGDVVTDIIQGAGFRARVHSDLKDVEVKRAIQSIETDIEFLSRLVESYGGILKSDGETVGVVPRDSIETASGKRLDTVRIAKDDCSKYSWGKNQRSTYKSVVVFYQDEASGATQAHVAGSGKPELRLKNVFNSEAGARLAAEKKLGQLKHINTIQLTTIGQNIAAGSALRVTGFPQPLIRDYQVTRVKHQFGNGYTVQVEAEGE